MKESLSFLKNNDVIKEFNSIMDNFKEFRNSDIPLCAAENIISDFSKKPLTMGLQERYILGGYLDYDINNNMIGSEKVLPLYHLLNKQCNKIFGSNYCDSRSLSGMNGMINILLALTKEGDTILLSSPDCGGHASLPNIISRLGAKIIFAPFDYTKYDYDYDKINVILKTNKIDFVLLAPSDLITVPKFDLIDYYENIIYIFDASQIMGLIAGKVVDNPLTFNNNMVVLSGTHKTIPGVTKAIILTNNVSISNKIDSIINPDYLRNTQLHHVASLIYTFLEVETFGEAYAQNMIKNSNYLGNKLESYGFNVAKICDDIFTNTHQLFIAMSPNETDYFFEQCIKYNITLNKKCKPLYNGTGIRLGVQEITRYGWNKSDLDIVAKILFLIQSKNINKNEIVNLINSIKYKKEIQYTF